jgi:hypothetical protein
MSPPDSRISLFELLVLLVMLIAGLAVLLPHVQRSVFYDEAWVIEAAIAPSVTEGWAVLLHDKSPAGAGYTAMLHELAVLSPPSIGLSRAAHMVFALAAVLLAMKLAHAWHPSGWAMIVPAALLLAMPMFQRYGTEVKQYIVEAALTLGLIVAAQAWLAGPAAKRRRAGWCWFILALLAVLMTFAGWFSVAGTGGVVFLAWLMRGEKAQLRRTMAMGTAIAAVAAVMHTQYNKHISGSSILEGYWTDYYLPLSGQWPAKLGDMLTKLFSDCWYRYERLPGRAMLIAAVIGFIAWIRRRPASGVAALAVVLVTLAASTARLWPLNLRVNLHLLVILHLAVAAGPVVFVSWLAGKIRRARANGSERPPARAAWAVLSVMGALFVAGLLWRESRGASYEVESNGRLLDEVAKAAVPGDIVILLPAAAISQRLAPRAIAGLMRTAPWPAKATIVRDVMPLAGTLRRPVLIAVSHHKPASGVPEAVAELGQAFSPFGRFSQQRFEGDDAGGVAIYRFEPTSR